LRGSGSEWLVQPTEIDLERWAGVHTSAQLSSLPFLKANSDKSPGSRGTYRRTTVRYDQKGERRERAAADAMPDVPSIPLNERM